MGSTEIFVQDLWRSNEARVWRTIYLAPGNQDLVGYSLISLTSLTYKGYIIQAGVQTLISMDEIRVAL